MLMANKDSCQQLNNWIGENKAFFVAQLWKGVVLTIQKEQTGGNLAVKCVSTL